MSGPDRAEQKCVDPALLKDCLRVPDLDSCPRVPDLTPGLVVDPDDHGPIVDCPLLMCGRSDLCACHDHPGLHGAALAEDAAVQPDLVHQKLVAGGAADPKRWRTVAIPIDHG